MQYAILCLKVSSKFIQQYNALNMGMFTHFASLYNTDPYSCKNNTEVAAVIATPLVKFGTVCV